MEAVDVISELKAIYKEGVPYRDLDRHLDDADLLRWSALHGWSRSQLFEEIAKFLAAGFNASELSFEFCDAIVNDLFHPYIDTLKPKSELFWDVYLAFDEGEYYHDSNRQEDPVETYTRPMIARIVATIENSATPTLGGGSAR
jgi:hypothetical protein